VQHYWVNIVEQQVEGGAGPVLKDKLIQLMEAAQVQTKFLRQSLLSKQLASIQQNEKQSLRVLSIKTDKWHLNGATLSTLSSKHT